MSEPLSEEQLESMVIANRMICKEEQFHSRGVAYGMLYDIERLAAEVRRLREENDRLAEEKQTYRSAFLDHDHRAARDAARAEADRLREESTCIEPGCTKQSAYCETHYDEYGRNRDYGGWITAAQQGAIDEHSKRLVAERDAARADLARAIELLRACFGRRDWDFDDMQRNVQAFLAEMEKR